MPPLPRTLPSRLLRRLYAGVRGSVAALGWLNGGLQVFDSALRRLSGGAWRLVKYRFVAHPVSAASLCHGRGASIEVRLLRRRNELPPAYPRPSAVLDQRYRQGAFSLAAWRHGELSGFLWLLCGSYQEDEVRVRYHLTSPRSAWDFDVWVRPEDRFGLTFGRLWDEANRLLRARAVHWSCSRISAFNGDSLRAHAALGAVGIGDATFLICGNWQWMLATLPPYLHLSRRHGACPQLAFDTSALPHTDPPSTGIS
jgi:hypothetical protein